MPGCIALPDNRDCHACGSPIGDAVINDGPGLLLIVEKQPDGNTLQVTRDVEAALNALKPGLKDIEIDPTIFRPATFIEMSLENLNRALLIGCVLVIVVLAVFLYDWRTALISIIAIPLSLLAAALLLRYRGGTLDTMVIAGLIIALGEVVDDAIIDVENIVRRLRLNRAASPPRPAFDVVLDASLEVRSAVVYGSVIVVLVFMPVFLLEGLAGSFFRPLALTYALAILASLLVALMVTPALSLLLLPKATREKESPAVTWLEAQYRGMVPRLVDKPRTAITIVAVALAVTAAAVPLLGEEFLPNFKEYDFLMHWVEKPGTSLEAMQRITLRASRELRAVEGVRNFGSHIGRPEVADEVVGPNFTELWISLDPEVQYEETVAQIQSVVDGYPGLYRDLLTYLRERIKEDYMETATPGVKSTRDGWLNRYLQAEAGERNPLRGVAVTRQMPRSLQGLAPALAVGRVGEFGVRGDRGMRDSFESAYASAADEILNGTAGEAFDAMRTLQRVAPRMYQPSNGASFPRSPFGHALQEIARLAKADVGLEVAFAETGQWDHHVNEGGATGQIASRLDDFTRSLAALVQDLGDRMADTMILTMSEFGRAVAENGNRGTDHGYGNAMIAIGGPVKGGIYGRWPGLAADQRFERRDLAVTTDFRDVFGEVVMRQLGADEQTARRVFPGYALSTARCPGVIRA